MLHPYIESVTALSDTNTIKPNMKEGWTWTQLFHNFLRQGVLGLSRFLGGQGECFSS